MTYWGGVYTKIYSCITGADSWIFYVVFMLAMAGIVGIIQDSKNPYKKRILYLFIVSLASSFIARILLWIFLPTPEYLGFIK